MALEAQEDIFEALSRLHHLVWINWRWVCWINCLFYSNQFPSVRNNNNNSINAIWTVYITWITTLDNSTKSNLRFHYVIWTFSRNRIELSTSVFPKNWSAKIIKLVSGNFFGPQIMLNVIQSIILFDKSCIKWSAGNNSGFYGHWHKKFGNHCSTSTQKC